MNIITKLVSLIHQHNQANMDNRQNRSPNKIFALVAVTAEIGRQLQAWEVGAADVYQYRDFYADLREFLPQEWLDRTQAGARFYLNLAKEKLSACHARIREFTDRNNQLPT